MKGYSNIEYFYSQLISLYCIYTDTAIRGVRLSSAKFHFSVYSYFQTVEKNL